MNNKPRNFMLVFLATTGAEPLLSKGGGSIDDGLGVAPQYRPLTKVVFTPEWCIRGIHHKGLFV